MNIDDINISTFPISIAQYGNMSSEELRTFINAVSDDLISLGTTINEKIISLLNSLPETNGVDANISGIDGTAVYVDNNSSTIKDSGLFYDNTNKRPLSIYETFLFFIQIIANMENGLKEGVKIGTISSKVNFAANSTTKYDWPYFDGSFKTNLLQINSSNTITEVSGLTVSVDYIAKKLLITNTTNSPISCWGYVWHPVYSF